MNLRNFALTPFTPLRPGLEVAVTGSLVRDARTLAITYTLRGPLAGLVIPAPDPRPARRDGLWEATCFEFFLAAPGTPAYWEFNLSPAGHWNVYRFAGYRAGMTEETAVKALEVRVRQDADAVRLDLEWEAGTIMAPGQPLAATVAAVVELKDHGLTYWALTHGGPRPDFHRRDGFIIAL